MRKIMIGVMIVALMMFFGAFTVNAAEPANAKILVIADVKNVGTTAGQHSAGTDVTTAVTNIGNASAEDDAYRVYGTTGTIIQWVTSSVATSGSVVANVQYSQDNENWSTALARTAINVSDGTAVSNYWAPSTRFGLYWRVSYTVAVATNVTFKVIGIFLNDR